jgi:hypothetical protein
MSAIKRLLEERIKCIEERLNVIQDLKEKIHNTPIDYPQRKRMTTQLLATESMACKRITKLLNDLGYAYTVTWENELEDGHELFYFWEGNLFTDFTSIADIYEDITNEMGLF